MGWMTRTLRGDKVLSPSCKTSFCPSFLVTCHLWMKYSFGDFDMTWSNPDDCSGQTFVNFSPSIILFCLFVLSVEIRLRLYGSSCTKFGFKDSDVNINIQYPPHVSSPVWVRWCFFIVFHSHTSIKKYFHWYYFTFVVLQDLRWLFCGCCICRTHHIYMSFFFYIIFMLYEGFEMECIHRCISQMSCCWSRRASLWAVSHLLFT